MHERAWLHDKKELTEEHRMTLKRQKCMENKQNLCYFSFSILPSFFFIFFSFFLFFFVSFCLQVHDRDGLHDKMGLQLKALKARLLRRCVPSGKKIYDVVFLVFVLKNHRHFDETVINDSKGI